MNYVSIVKGLRILLEHVINEPNTLLIAYSGRY
jgi:hypothetical protein